MQNLDSVLDKLKTFRDDLIEGSLVVDHEVDLEDLIKIKEIEDELYETLLLIFTRNKNKMLTIKNDHTKNTLSIINMTISIIEIITANPSNNPVNNTAPQQPYNTQNNNTNNNNQPQQNGWMAIIKPDSVFKIALSIIIVLLVIWTMFIINPKATDDTMKSVSNIVDITKSKKE